MSPVDPRMGALREPAPSTAAAVVPYALPHPHKYPFEMDLAQARPRHGKHLIVALHHPPFSIDQMHGGSPQMLNLVHEPAKRAGCRLVVSGHAHTYQRFAFDGVTYVVNGAGGYFELHDLVSPPDPGTLTPVVAHTGEHSFMQVAVTPRELRLRTVAVPLPFEPTVGHPILVDEFRCPLSTLSSVAATGRTQ